ncbi:MAG: hypothetical protein K8S00_13060 [Bacteroidales bacterium]|nr:hypothetical protein [Bacteroidales bacterium]
MENKLKFQNEQQPNHCLQDDHSAISDVRKKLDREFEADNKVMNFYRAANRRHLKLNKLMKEYYKIS